ncbi:MAG: XrtA/PEP-CTERM system amidotransferase [Pseudomonadota bacterium]
MCGITGLFDLGSTRRPIEQGLLRRMNNVQLHRGPDGEGYHLEPGVGLGHRRLSIIDISTGQQPLSNHNDTIYVTFNGEIYNYLELREELINLNYSFKTKSDTEVIVHAWEEWGPECVKRFNGMFAFAIWDRNKRSLFLARDRVGIKPLYYGVGDNFLVFGSELKSLLEMPAIERKLCPKAIEEYFCFGYVPDPRSVFGGVHKLPPGHYMLASIDSGLQKPVSYWDVEFSRNTGLNSNEIETEIVARLKKSVDRRLMTEVPLGAFLSGGVDSSSIVAMMAGLIDEPVNTCSISFGDPKYNESQFADLVAKQFATDHQVEQVDPNDYDLIDDLARFYDEPFADSSAIPTYRVCQLARKRVTVALSGDGGDENFAGYRRYRWHMYEEAVRQRLPSSFRRAFFGFFGSVYPKADWAPKIFRAKSTLQAIARDSLPAYLNSVSIFPSELRHRLWSQSFRSDLQDYQAISVFQRHAGNSAIEDPLSLVQYVDFKTYLPGDILTKVDRASMAHSLEVRVPILDHEFVEFVAGIPSDVKLNGREGKFIFKKALEPHLPHDILYRDKMGFGVPISSWFRNELRDKVKQSLLAGPLADCDVFDMNYVETLVKQHQTGVREHSAVLWALLMFASFLHRCVP